MTVNTMLIYNRLKDMELAPERLARFVGVSRATMYRYINGTLMPPINVAYLIAHLLELKLTDIWPPGG